MKRLLNILILLAVSVSFAAAQMVTPEEMPNVNKANRYQFVSDPAGLLPSDVKERVNKQLWDLRQSTTVEAVVAIPPSLGDMPIEEFSEQLFTLWGIGKSDKDNGVLFVISPESKRVRIQTGYGVEGALPDISCKNIIERSVAPNMREGNLGAAVEGAVSEICGALTDPAVREELKSSRKDNFSGELTALSGDVIWRFVEIVASCVFLFALILFIYNFIHLRKRSNYDKAMAWRRQTTTFIWASVLSLGAAIPFLIVAMILARSYRTRRIRCETCGHKMNRLPEDKDNELLSPSQDFEERLKTVDYDVWECPHCGTIERFPFKEKQMKYTECPYCGTVAMCLKHERIIVPATEYRAGRGERIYECQFCHNRDRHEFVIPKKESAALAAAAALGAMSGGGGGGGGFGGGFGGGSTGGGGASGGW